MNKVRWGVLSTSNFALAKVIPALLKGAHLEVAAIASRDLDKAQAAAKRFGIAKAYGSYEELLANPGIDVIYNPMPNHLHVPWSIKDASGDLSRVTDHRMGIKGDFAQLSGDDELALPFNAAGGVGCISVTANVAPRLCAEFQQACAAGDLKKARELNDRLYPLHYAMFEDASPGPCKYALSRVQPWLKEELRLPLVPSWRTLFERRLAQGQVENWDKRLLGG